MAHAFGDFVMTDTRTIVATLLAESHLAQAESLKGRLDGPHPPVREARHVLWATYHAYLAAAERLLESVTGVEGAMYDDTDGAA